MFSEIDYAFYAVRKSLNLGATDARAYMIRTDKWKYIYFKGFAPQLFNLENDLDEFKDLGQHPDYSEIRENLKEMLLQRLINRKNLVTVDENYILKERNDKSEDDIMIGVW